MGRVTKSKLNYFDYKEDENLYSTSVTLDPIPCFFFGTVNNQHINRVRSNGNGCKQVDNKNTKVYHASFRVIKIRQIQNEKNCVKTKII